MSTTFNYYLLLNKHYNKSHSAALGRSRGQLTRRACFTRVLIQKAVGDKNLLSLQIVKTKESRVKQRNDVISRVVNTRLLLKQEGKSYRVSPLGEHCYLRENTTVSFLKPRIEGSNQGTVKMWGAPDHGDESIRRYF